ncbi:MAG TPA: MBL fold metallo-hydrolase, partial [Polyangiaceae bacterium]|nr:MBL fold metallo-hydrolase [Polyangiaceae bacterium]
MKARFVAIPCLRDNYAYLVSSGVGGPCVVVDAGEAEPVRRALAAGGYELAAILSTHHHLDHVGGNEELVREFGVPVYASERDRERIHGVTHALGDGQRAEVAGLEFTAMHLPGHTE